ALGPPSDLSRVSHESVIDGIGNNEQRRRIFARLQQQGEHLLVARHPSAVIAPDVTTGPGSMICAGVVVNPGTFVGANVILNTGSTVDHHNRVGDHAHLAPGVNTGGEVTIGEGALIGIGSTVMPGRTVGAWSTVGAGALITRDVPDGAVVIGSPARVVRSSPL
ncbi:MAG: acetyltransferase, partial [Syntrophales bacterium LBB04]|nr:acetyltransferase [Syntrophales bacterium LBB04]